MKSEPVKITAREIEVAKLLNWRQHVIVPNVWWGLGLRHECDVLSMNIKTRRFTEVEIKISLQDLKADFKKAHGHDCEWISRLVYAMPENLLETAVPLIPKHCGIIGVRDITYSSNRRRLSAYWYRVVKGRDCKPSDQIVDNFMRLGCMRIWTLKQHLVKAELKLKLKSKS